MSGRVTVRNTQSGLAPSVPAASSSLRSTASIDSRMARTISGKPMTAQASAAPVQRKEKTMPKASVEEGADRPAPAEADQQQVAGHDRRQDQRQVDERVEQRSCPRTAARQQPRDRDPERQARQRSPRWRPAGSAGRRSTPRRQSLRQSVEPVVVQHREALLLEGGARLGAAQEGEEGLGVGVRRILGERRRDRRSADACPPGRSPTILTLGSAAASVL